LCCSQTLEDSPEDFQIDELATSQDRRLNMLSWQRGSSRRRWLPTLTLPQCDVRDWSAVVRPCTATLATQSAARHHHHSEVTLSGTHCRRLADVDTGGTEQRCAVFRLRTCDHVTDALVTLHWLRLQRIPVQTFCSDVHVARRSTTLPWSVRPSRRSAWSTNTPVCQHQPSCGTTRQTVSS